MMTSDVRSAVPRLRDPRRLGGTAEIAEELSVGKSRVSMWISRRDSTHFPGPVRLLRMGDLYDLDEVLTWWTAWRATRRDR